MRVSNAPIRMLITFAYDIRDFQLAGGPSWMNTERYDILAKSDRSDNSDNTPVDPRKMNDAQRMKLQEDMRQKVRALLADRFELTIHREDREGPVYALVPAKGGSKLKPVQESESGPVGLRMGRGQLTGMAAQIPMLTNILSGQLGRPVVDKTGLTGKYDFKLEWTPDQGPAGAPADPSKGGEPAPVSTDPDGPSLFTAIQEQLGLRLESQKGPVETIVVDRIEKPSQN